MNHTDLSMMSTTMSELNVSYSSIGVYDQMIMKEKSRQDQLTQLVKIRERKLMDRTKGQLAWLELQKQKYKEKGMTNEISTIRKKQRAILLKLEKERTEIHK
jgi:centrosomal protein CEP350